MPEPTVEWFNLGFECVSLEVQRCGNQVLVGFQIIYAIDHGEQALQLLEKPSNCFEWSAATDNAKGFTKSRIHRYPDPAFGFILAKELQSSLISMNEQASVLGGITGNCPAGWASQRETVLWCTPRFCQWLWALVPRGIAFESAFWRLDSCLCAVSERFVDKLGSGSVEHLDSYQRM